MKREFILLILIISLLMGSCSQNWECERFDPIKKGESRTDTYLYLDRDNKDRWGDNVNFIGGGIKVTVSQVCERGSRRMYRIMSSEGSGWAITSDISIDQ